MHINHTMLRHMIISWTSITIFTMQYSSLSAVTSFKESFWRAERRRERRTRRKLFREKLLNYFFTISSTLRKARRDGILYSIRLCLTVPVSERGSSPLSLTSFPSGKCVDVRRESCGRQGTDRITTLLVIGSATTQKIRV